MPEMSTRFVRTHAMRTGLGSNWPPHSMAFSKARGACIANGFVYGLASPRAGQYRADLVRQPARGDEQPCVGEPRSSIATGNWTSGRLAPRSTGFALPFVTSLARRDASSACAVRAAARSREYRAIVACASVRSVMSRAAA